METAVLHKN